MTLHSIRKYRSKAVLYGVLCLCGYAMYAQNPLITDQFTADPSARVFGDRVYVYPSHDIRCDDKEHLRPKWFCMEDYHVFSSENLTDWTDHGVIVSQKEVPWADATAYSMWAPDCIEKDGKYFFYFPAKARDTTLNGKGFSIGVAVADSPEGPFVPQPLPIRGVRGIDPNVMIDKDGQAYLYWSEKHIYGAKLRDNMLELASEPKILRDLPEEGLKEGPFVFESAGTYYMTYPHVADKTERLEYATGKDPLGPFTYRGVIMDKSPDGCWTNHQSVVNFRDQWYLFYHHNDLSPGFDKNRAIRADSLFFNADGSIQKVYPTLRGIGRTQSSGPIHSDRYSDKSKTGVSVTFLNQADTFAGWKTIMDKKGGWIRYNSVDFGKETPRYAVFRVRSGAGAILQLHPGNGNAPVLCDARIPKTETWNTVKVPLHRTITGIHDLVLELLEGTAEIDWMKFE